MRAPTLLFLAVLVVTAAVYAQTANHGFINFDDPRYVTENARVKGGLSVDNAVWAFKAIEVSNWHPLTWLSHMADVELFGLRPAGHHLMNVFLHLAGTAVLFFLLFRLTAAPWQSLTVAALFALHPLHVESVAWIAERKDLLSCLFALLTVWAYASYAKRPGWNRYVAALLLFAAGLLAKPMIVTLPVVLLLLDYWPLGRYSAAAGVPRRLSELAAEKVPFFLLSAASSLVTILAQHSGGAMKSMDAVPFALRVANALVSYGTYLVKTFVPTGLAMFYPFPQTVPVWEAAGSLLVLTLISVAAFRLRRRAPYVLVGWAWYLVTLLPVIGLIQVGGQALADRYTYIPLIGVFIVCAWGTNDLLKAWPSRKAALGAAAVGAVLACAALTWKQLGYWKDEVDLYRRTVSLTPGNYVILNNYGIALAKRGDLDGAVRSYSEALKIWPRSANAELNLGSALFDQGRLAEALPHYMRVLQLRPDDGLAEMGLGKTTAALGRPDEAVRHYERALALNPSSGDAHYNLGVLLSRLGRVDEAWQHYRAALELDPWSPRVQNNMGVAFAQQGRFDEAAGYFREALRLDPEFYEAHFNWGVALAKQNRIQEAVPHFEEVLRRKPDSAQARRWLALLGGAYRPGGAEGLP